MGEPAQSVSATGFLDAAPYLQHFAGSATPQTDASLHIASQPTSVHGELPTTPMHGLGGGDRLQRRDKAAMSPSLDEAMLRAYAAHVGMGLAN